ncbi:MAG: hypothetical protein P4L28_07495 [Paludibacteraceae bacterium]|nr:hypothetical protein [Paludibacteraceae bacterium]
MKKIIFTLAVTSLIAGAFLTSCNSSAKKVKDAQAKVEETQKDATEAKTDLKKEKQDSINEHLQFKKEAEDKINAHNKSIADFKARIVKEKKQNRAQYEKKLAKLEQKNSDLKKELEDYKDGGKDKWIKFKNGFNKDMEDLGNGIKNFSFKNVK